MTNRRKFMRDLLVAGGALGAVGGFSGLTRLAAAGGASSHQHYVFAYFSGGWDVLLSLDPRDPATFTPEDNRIGPDYDELVGAPTNEVRTIGGMTFGPHIGMLSDHADRLAIIRGMSMETLTHEVGRRRFLTGHPPSGLSARGSSIATWISARNGVLDPVPHLSIGVETYNVDQPTYASALRVGGASDLVRVFTPGTPMLDPTQDDILQAFLSSEAGCDRSRHSPMLRESDGSRERLLGMLESNLAGLFDIGRMDAALKDRFAVTGTDYTTPEAQSLVTFQALTNGVSRCVSLSPATGLDTHFTEWTRDQGPRQQRGFDAIARLVTELQGAPYAPEGFTPDGTTWLDHTTIVGFSEFSRTPIRNDRGGRDHWLGNSAFMIGGNVQGGVVGRSSDYGMEPQPVNLETGEYDPAGEVILPDHILRTLLVDAGVTADEADLRVDPIRAIIPV
jgi:hypothetical protein